MEKNLIKGAPMFGSFFKKLKKKKIPPPPKKKNKAVSVNFSCALFFFGCLDPLR